MFSKPGSGLVRHSKAWLLMSALGHKRTLKHVRLMSALPPKADIETQSCAKSRHLFPSPMIV